MNPQNDDKEIIIDDLDLELPKTKEEVVEETISPTIEIDTIDDVDDISETEEAQPVTFEEMENKEEVINKPKKEKHQGRTGLIIRRVLNLVIWLIVLGIAAVWVVDFIMVKQEKEPKFCLNTKTHTFTDGTVEECVGLGYKVYKYDRESISAIEFGPIFINMREK